MRTWRTVSVITLTVIAGGLCLLVASGALDETLPGGRAQRTLALSSVLSYFLLTLMVTGFALQWRQRRAQLLLMLGSVLFVLIAFEWIARRINLPAGIPEIVNMGAASKDYHHRYPPNQKFRLGTVGGELLTLQTNEDGFRSHYSRSQFRDASPRIAILGDSFTFGLGVPQGAEFSVLLEQSLRAETKGDVAILNAGIVSYSPFLERLLFDDVVKHYEPDLVLLMIDTSDIGDDIRYEQESTPIAGRPSFPFDEDHFEDYRHYGPLFEISKPLREWLHFPIDVTRGMLGNTVAAAKYPTFAFDFTLRGKRETNQFFIYRFPLELTGRFFQRTLDHIGELARAVKSTGAEFAVIVIPRFQHWNPKECPENWESNRYQLNEPYQDEYFRFFEQAKSRVDYPIFSLLPAFQKTDEFPLVLNSDPHWNKAGHAFVARTLADYLLESSILPALAR